MGCPKIRVRGRGVRKWLRPLMTDGTMDKFVPSPRCAEIMDSAGPSGVGVVPQRRPVTSTIVGDQGVPVGAERRGGRLGS